MAYDGTANEFKILQDTYSEEQLQVFTHQMKRKFLLVRVLEFILLLHQPVGEGKRLSFTPRHFSRDFRIDCVVMGLMIVNIVGDYSFIGHYNGYGWRYFDELWSDNISLLSVAQKGDLVVAVGYQYLLP